MVVNRFPAVAAGSYEEPGTSSTGNENAHGTLRRIEAAYSDNPVVDTEEDSASRALEASANRNGNTQNRSGSHGPAVQPSRLHDGNNEWAED